MLNDLTLKIHNKIPPNFQRCWGKVKNAKKKLLIFFQQGLSKLKKGYSQDLVKQTVAMVVGPNNYLQH